MFFFQSKETNQTPINIFIYRDNAGYVEKVMLSGLAPIDPSYSVNWVDIPYNHPEFELPPIANLEQWLDRNVQGVEESNIETLEDLQEEMALSGYKFLPLSIGDLVSFKGEYYIVKAIEEDGTVVGMPVMDKSGRVIITGCERIDWPSLSVGDKVRTNAFYTGATELEVRVGKIVSFEDGKALVKYIEDEQVDPRLVRRSPISQLSEINSH